MTGKIMYTQATVLGLFIQVQQVGQLLQRDRAAGWVSYRQK